MRSLNGWQERTACGRAALQEAGALKNRSVATRPAMGAAPVLAITLILGAVPASAQTATGGTVQIDEIGVKSAFAQKQTATGPTDGYVSTLEKYPFNWNRFAIPDR